MSRMNNFKNVLLAVIFSLSMVINFEAAWAGEKYVAQVSEFKGEPIIERGSDIIKVEMGTRLQNKDSIKTGSGGSIGIVFNDETTLSLGPDSNLMIQSYVFNPSGSEFSFVVRLFKGTASYVSGLLAKLSPDATELITPSASIGVRGTKFVIQVDGI
jgi:hypothetical protein